LSIQPKAQQSAHSEQNYDIRHFAPTIHVTSKQHQNLPSNRVIFTDTPELVAPYMEKRQDTIMQSVYDVLKENESLFVGLHVSDEFPDHMNATGSRKVIQLICKIPSDQKQLKPLVKLACDLVDVFTVDLRLHSKIQERNKKFREEKKLKLREEKEENKKASDKTKKVGKTKEKSK
jgi:hypothetical protein